eukprot:1617941-Prorocentrum_lima.AAC.1
MTTDTSPDDPSVPAMPLGRIQALGGTRTATHATAPTPSGRLHEGSATPREALGHVPSLKLHTTAASSTQHSYTRAREDLNEACKDRRSRESARAPLPTKAALLRLLKHGLVAFLRHLRAL